VPVEIRCEESRLVFTDEAAQLFGQSRPLTDRDFQRFQDWADRYRLALADRDPAAALVAIGREMYFWLNGGELWLEQSRQFATSPWKLEFAVPLEPGDNDQRFLNAPWELLADADGHLAARRDLVFCPARRVGRRTKPLAPSPYRLSMVFMAAAPRGVANLQFEQEEAAILQAAGSVGIDLAVEETGTLQYLGDCWTDEVSALQGRPDVLHISCHGTAKPAPSLIFENDEGGPDPVSAGQLKTHLRGELPRLLFLSACETADPDPEDLLGSLAVAMLRQGIPATLGWAGSVRDLEASRFAQEIYQRLAGFEELEAAVAQARLEMLNPSVQQPGQPGSRDWHLARLYLGPQGGGKLCSTKRVRRQRDPQHAVKAFLDVQGRTISVASRYEFVGRRRQIQDVLRAFRAGRGVVIRGLGRQGKSSLASRIATRMQDHVTVVLYGDYQATTVLAKLKEALGAGEAVELIERWLSIVAQNPAALEKALRELLEGPCRESEPPVPGSVQRRSVLLVVDDFETALEPPAGGLHRVKQGLVSSVAAVLRAFRGAQTQTQSRLLFTSRFRFALPDGSDHGRDLADYLEQVPLPSMDEVERRKQLHAKLRSLGKDERLAYDERSQRILSIAGGNPGLQDCLLLLALESGAACDRALEQMATYLARGTLPDEQKVRDFLQNLALDSLIALLTPHEHTLLAASTVFQFPVPDDVLRLLDQRLCGTDHSSHDAVTRLHGLGLWETHEDPCDFSRPAALLHPLVRALVGELPAEQERGYIALVLDELFRAWGGPEGRREVVANWELTRLALIAGNLEVLQATAEPTLYFLASQFSYPVAASCARHVIDAFDAARRSPPATLLVAAGHCCRQHGDVAAARQYYSRAMAHYETASARGEPVNEYHLAMTLVASAQQLCVDAQPGPAPPRALEYFQRAERLLQGAGHVRNRALVLSEIAQIRVERGQVEEGLKLFQEQIDIFEALGDQRSRAVTLARVAGILVERGRAEEGLKLYHEQLEVFAAVGDHASRAGVLGDIARILVARGQVDDGLKLHREKLEIVAALGDLRAQAVTLGDIAHILVERGQLEEGLKLYEEALAACEASGDQWLRAATLFWVAQVRGLQGDRVGQVKCLKESYAIGIERGHVGWTSSIALVLGPLLLENGGDDAAFGREILTRARDYFQQLGSAQLVEVAELFLRRGDGTA
jgi:tetratricopeptide (TPR) repeat protein